MLEYAKIRSVLQSTFASAFLLKHGTKEGKMKHRNSEMEETATTATEYPEDKPASFSSVLFGYCASWL